MTSENIAKAETPAAVAEASPAAGVDEQYIEELVARAQADGLQPTGEGGWCSCSPGCSYATGKF